MSILIHRWALLVGQLKVIAFPALELFGRWGGWDGQPWQDCLAHAAAETEPLHAALKRSGGLGAGQVSFIFIVWLFEANMYDFCQRHLSWNSSFPPGFVEFFSPYFLAEAPLKVDNDLLKSSEAQRVPWHSGGHFEFFLGVSRTWWWSNPVIIDVILRSFT